MNAEEWIEYLQLEPHPEGGFYRSTYRQGLTFQVSSCLSGMIY